MANTVSLGRRSITIIPDGSVDFDLATMQTNKFPMGTVVGDFTVGETVTQATSNATGVVARWDKRQSILWLYSMTGTFDLTHVATGGSSSAHGIPSETAAAFPNGIRLSAVRFTPSGAGDRLIIRGKGAVTGPILFSLVAGSAADISRSPGGHSLRENLYIDASEQDWGLPANVVIVLEFD